MRITHSRVSVTLCSAMLSSALRYACCESLDWNLMLPMKSPPFDKRANAQRTELLKITGESRCVCACVYLYVFALFGDSRSGSTESNKMRRDDVAKRMTLVVLSLSFCAPQTELFRRNRMRQSRTFGGTLVFVCVLR